MKYLQIFAVLVFFSSCGSSQKLEPQPPVELGQVYYQKTVGGREESPAVYKIFVPVENMEVKLKVIYFRNQIKPLTIQDNNLYAAVFSISENEKDFTMNSNPKAEYGNTSDLPKQEFPFPLQPHEAVVSYEEDGKLKFFKIEKVLERQTVYMPQMKQKNNG